MGVLRRCGAVLGTPFKGQITSTNVTHEQVHLLHHLVRVGLPDIVRESRWPNGVATMTADKSVAVRMSALFAIDRRGRSASNSHFKSFVEYGKLEARRIDKVALVVDMCEDHVTVLAGKDTSPAFTRLTCCPTCFIRVLAALVRGHAEHGTLRPCIARKGRGERRDGRRIVEVLRFVVGGRGVVWRQARHGV